MKKISCFLTFALILSGCSPQFMMGMRDQKETDYIIAELRSEIADLRQEISHHNVEFQILDEKLEKAYSSKANDTSHKISELSKIEKKISDLERLLEKTKEDLRELAAHANQSSSSFNQYREKLFACERQIAHQSEVLSEVTKLKGTLTSLSKAMQAPVTAAKSYKVKSGDSLEKIARHTNCSIDQLKKLNGLNNDTIMVGQELKIP